MRILLTGSTSSHVSARKNAIMPTFMGQINKALSYAGHDVLWTEPSVTMSYEFVEEFDSVIVGVAPPNSTSAHRIYGALSVIDHAHKAGNLRLVVDAPDPKRVWAGIRAIHNKPEELIKEFYTKRKEYRKAENPEVFERLKSSIDFLYLEQWPTTVFPMFPWMGFPSVSSEIERTDNSNLVGLNFDEEILSTKSFPSSQGNDYWVADNMTSVWTRNIEKTINSPVIAMSDSKRETAEVVMNRLSSSIGCLVSVYSKGSPWWSVSLSQALHRQIPVVTDWRLSQSVGDSWTVLAHSIEDMNSNSRAMLANSQKEEYLKAVPSWKDSVELACDALVRTRG